MVHDMCIVHFSCAVHNECLTQPSAGGSCPGSSLPRRLQGSDRGWGSGTTLGLLAAAVIGVVTAQMTTDFGGQALTTAGGFRVAMLIGCGVALLAAVIAALIPVRATGGKGTRERADSTSEPVTAHV